MRSPAINLIALGVSAGVICSHAFLSPILLPGGSTSTARHARAYPSSRGQQHRLSLRRESAMVAVTALRMSEKGEEEATEEAGPAPEGEAAAPEADAGEMPNVADLMEKAQEADYVARATTSNVMGPAMQPPEEKKKEKEDFELSKPEENKWASGAFKRGLALQAVVVSFVIFLQVQPPEVNSLAICAPFTKGGGCVGFGEWVQIVFFGAPVPPM